MLVATWNVNSIKARHDRAMAWLDKVDPDVVCLQELKMTDEAFPYDGFRDRGYQCTVYGQKTWNGVAILSKSKPVNVVRGFDHVDEQSRLVAAEVDGVIFLSAYFPNGKTVGSDKWEYKLKWMAALEDTLKRNYSPGDPVALCGDFNIAPEDRDVAMPERWRNSVLCHQAGREALARIRGRGFVDTMRMYHSDAGPYSWWDYRRLAFPKGDGLRIDHIYATESLAATCVEAFVDRDERKGQKPSDHAPVLARFE